MFYDKNKDELITSNVYYKEVEIDGEAGVDTYFLDKCGDEILRELDIAKVIEKDRPSYDETYEKLSPKYSYDEAKNEYIVEFEVVSKDIGLIKETILENLSSTKDDKLKSVIFKDNEYQADTEAKINISGKVSQILLAMNTDSPITRVSWITKDNKTISMSSTDFLEFGVAIANHSEEVIFTHNSLRDRVNNASSVDELKEIVWE